MNLPVVKIPPKQEHLPHGKQSDSLIKAMIQGTASIDVLYVHPRVRCTLDYVIPVGVTGLVNASPGNRLGRYAFEVSDREIKAARLVLLDCHWYPTLLSVKHLCERIRRLNKNAVIICGGYTATVFAEQLVNHFDIDYVVVGDAEGPLPDLVGRLLTNQQIDLPGNPVSNIVGKNGLKTPRNFRLTAELYGQQDYTTINWFPTMNRYANQLAHSGIATQTYPWISVFKGCLLKCDFCYGNRNNHEFITGRANMVARPAGAVRDDLRYYSRHKNRFWVHIIADFVTMLRPEYRDTVFSEEYDLGLYYEFYNPPKKEQIDQMAKSFKRCFFGLSIVHDHAQNPENLRFVSEKRLEEVLSAMTSYDHVQVTLFYDPEARKSVPGLYKRLRYLQKKYGLYLQKSSLWRMRVPTLTFDKKVLENEFSHFLKTSKEWRLTWVRFLAWHSWRFIPSMLPFLYRVTTFFAKISLYFNGRFEKNREWRGR